MYRVCSIIALLAGTVQASSYHIGNSLTWDALEGVRAVTGTDLEAGYHIRCGGSLPYIWGHPTDTCLPSVPSYGTFNDALPNHNWDAVTIQPYFDSTLAIDTVTINQFIGLTRSRPENSQTVFYVYETWPQTIWGQYGDVWNTPAVDEDDTLTWQRRGYFEHLYNRIDNSTDAIVRSIPVGEVLYQLSLQLDINDFYRDEIHLSELGRYVAGATFQAVIAKTNPFNALPQSALEPDLYPIINETILQVVFSDVRTGLTDFNSDGLTDGNDLALWTAGDPKADADLNGIIDGNDFLMWQRNVQDVPPLSVTTIPESSPFTLMVIAAPLLVLYLRK